MGKGKVGSAVLRTCESHHRGWDVSPPPPHTHTHAPTPPPPPPRCAAGTFLNGEKIETSRYYELLEKDVIKFAFSSREYVLLHPGSQD